MSYLEGDSLLREIERSLERQDADIDFQQNIDDDDEDIDAEEDEEDALLERPSALGGTDTDPDRLSIGGI
jgi:hypothetical protein